VPEFGPEGVVCAIKRKYTDAGRPTRTKLDLAERAAKTALNSTGSNPPADLRRRPGQDAGGPDGSAGLGRCSNR